MKGLKFNSLFSFRLVFFFFLTSYAQKTPHHLLLSLQLFWSERNKKNLSFLEKWKQSNEYLSTLFSQARRICFGLKNCFSFMLSCQLVLSAMMLLSSCVLLPPPLTGLHLLWLSCLIVPLLSLSLIGSPSDPNLMTMMTGKNDKNFKVTFNNSWFPCVLVCRVRLWYLR